MATFISTTSRLVDESLPNIRGGNVQGIWGEAFRGNGALYTTDDVSANGGGTTGVRQTFINFDASRFSSIYQDNANIRPLSIIVAFYIRY